MKRGNSFLIVRGIESEDEGDATIHGASMGLHEPDRRPITRSEPILSADRSNDASEEERMTENEEEDYDQKEDDASDESGKSDEAGETDVPLRVRTGRHLSVEEMALALAQQELQGHGSTDVHHNSEIAEDVQPRKSTTWTQEDGLTEKAANETAALVQQSIEDTAFGLPHVDLEHATRKSSLQMIAAAAKEFREMHRASSQNVTDPEAMTRVAQRRAWWKQARQTAGFLLLFFDALYVLISAPFRVGFLYDPWDLPARRTEWTQALSLFSALDLIGGLVRVLFLYRQVIARRDFRPALSSPVATPPTSTLPEPKEGRQGSIFRRPSRLSLFSTRSSVVHRSPIQSTQVLDTVRQVQAAQTYEAPITALVLGVIPYEVVIVVLNYNWLHVAPVGKLLFIWYTLAPSYSALLLRCRRFQWAQWLSFSTLATPFYLFWLGLYLCHVTACGYLFLANIECGLESQFCSKTPIPGSWILKDNMEKAQIWRRYVRTMYWASKTVTTLGQGDLVPTTQMETNYCVVVQYVSGLWATAFLASCSFYFSRRDKDIEDGVSTRLEQALRFLRSRKVPSGLALQIRNYYQHIQRTRKGIEEDQVLANLPAHYRSQCSFFVKFRLLAKVPFFAKQPKAFLRSVVENIENDFLSPKQVITPLFDIVELVIVARGEINVLDESKISIGLVIQDEWFGEEALFEEARSKYELEAKTFCEVLRLSRQHFQACMEKHFPRLKIATMMAQQKRRLAMIPSMDNRLHLGVSATTVYATGRPSGRSTVSKMLLQTLGSDTNGIPWNHPGSTFRKRWRRWKTALMIFVAIEAPFEIAFEWRGGFIDSRTSTAQQLVYAVAVLAEIFFYADWYFRACVFARTGSLSNASTKELSARDLTMRSMREDLAAAAASKSQESLLAQPKDLLRLYMAGDGFWIDIIVNLPIAMIWNLVNQSSYSIVVREFMRMTRILQLGRLLYLRPSLKKIMVEIDLSPASQLLASVILFCVITANAMACYFYLLADDKDFFDALPTGFDPDLTPVSAGDCLEQATLYGNCTWYIFDRSFYSIKARYIRSLHWSLVLLSTVGYGDILSFTNSECLLGFWWIYLGALICYFTSCAVGSVVSQVTVLKTARDSRVEEITRALVRSSVSSTLRVMIRSHYQANWELNGSVLSEASMMEHLPRTLRHQLSSSLYVQDIRRCYVFSCLGGQAGMLRAIALLLSSEVFLPGVTIVENGRLATALYLIQSGDVELLLPFDSSQRFGSTVRRRSVLENTQGLQNPLRRLYYIISRFVRRHRTSKSDGFTSTNGHMAKHRQPLGIPIAALREGGCFGEEGLLPDSHSALKVSVRTLTGTQVAILDRDAFMSLAGKFPVQVRQIVTLIGRKQEADSALYETLRSNFRSRSKAVELMGMSPSLFCETKVQVNNIITPDRLQYRTWHIIHGIVIFYNFYAITFRLAFLPKPSKTVKLALSIIDYITDAFLYTDIYLKWNRFGYEEYGDNIVDLTAIRRRYKKRWFKVDCWSMVPTYYYGDFFYMSVARVPRLLKSLQLIENIETIEALIREKFMKGSSTLLSSFDLIKFLLFFLSAAHHIGSIYFLIGRLLTEHGVVADSWMTVDPIITAYPGDILVQYNRAIYWCLETFTVVCFGDVIARNSVETVYASMTCIVGWMCIGQVVGRITSLMANIDKDGSEHNARVENFEKFAHENSIPQYLRERAIESIEYKSKCLVEHKLRHTFADLPPAMHSMLFDELYGSLIRRIPELHETMKPAQLRVLADALTLHLYVTDDIILEEGRLGRTLYVMKEGRGEYYSAQSQIVFAAVSEGQLFGDVAFFIPDARHMLSVRASRSCQVLQVDRRTWNELWDESSRQALEEKFEALAQQKQITISRAHANIARNLSIASLPLGTTHEDTADNKRYSTRDRSDSTMSARILHYRSSLQGYSTFLASIHKLLWRKFSGKVAPAFGYVPSRPSKKAAIVAGSHKLRRSLGFDISNTNASMKSMTGTAKPNGRQSVSAYAHHMDTIKSRFQRRQERSMFNLQQLSSGDIERVDDSGSASDIWVEPPPPPAFCLENSTFRRWWNALMYLICLYYVLIVPFRVSFDYEFLSNQDTQTLVRVWFGFEYLMDILCVTDFVLQKDYFTFVHRGSLVTEKHAIRHHYLHEGSYVIDLFCILPFEILLPLAPLSNAPGTTAKVTWYRVAVCRINKMIRIVHLHALGEKVQRMLVYDVKVSHVRASVIYCFRFAFDFALGAHWVACMYYGASFNAIDISRPSWLTVPGMLTFEGRTSEADVGKVPVQVKYARSYHFSMGAITTVSYGDIAPQNAWETFFTTFVIVISIVLFGMLSGGFNQTFEMELGQRADYEEKIASVAHFMMFHQFPTRIWKHMQSYFMVHWRESQGMNEEELLSGLPQSVKDDITLFVKQDFVKQMRLFAGCDEAFVRAVVASFDQELFVRHDVIITYGDRGRSLYVIESGSVLVRIPQSPVAAKGATTGTSDPAARPSVSVAADVEIIKGRFDFFGEKSLIFDIPRSATCIALSSCIMLILTVEKYDAIIEKFPEYREKNMRDWIFAHPTSDRNRAGEGIRQIATASTVRKYRAKLKTSD